jgi:hypothetical protein
VGVRDLLRQVWLDCTALEKNPIYRGRDVQSYQSGNISAGGWIVGDESGDPPFFTDDGTEGAEKANRSLATFQLHAGLDLKQKKGGKA